GKRLENFIGKDQTAKDLGNAVKLNGDTCFAGLDCGDKVINHPEVNYVVLATPPGFRPLHLQAAVDAKKTIFTEKPVAVDGTGIRKVLEAYDKSQKLDLGIAAGTQRRHQLGYLETMKRVEAGDIGDIVALRCYWNNSHDIWFRERAKLRTDLGVEDSDLAYQLHNWYHFLWTCGDHIV